MVFQTDKHSTTQIQVTATMNTPKSILITGASSGIGAALARIYANPGVTLALCARREDRLAGVAETCRKLGAQVKTSTLDVADKAAMEHWIMQRHNAAPLDLVIANAGVSYGFEPDEPLAEHMLKTCRTNIDGVFHTVQPALDLMIKRGHGQIAIMSSLAGFHGLPSAPAYSVSKATVKAYGEALRGVYAHQGIRINVICPGFVTSEMTARNNFPMPFMVSSDKAARIIRRGLAANRPRIAFPWPMIAAVRLLGLLPESWLQHLLASAPRKN